MLLSPTTFRRKVSRCFNHIDTSGLHSCNKRRRASMAHFPVCSFPLPLSIPGWLVNLEMFLLISPDHFGDAVVTVTAHGSLDVSV
jgi:hypothetical protein